MGKRIELPAQPSGNATEQLQKMYSYLYQVATTINANLDEIGGMEFTDEEMRIVNKILNPDDSEEGTPSYNYKEAETLKSLIIKTANFVQQSLQEYRLNLLGEYVAEGKFGKYVRKTGLDVEVTPEHIMQSYQLQEIIQGLKVYEINAKNYIKTGLLRTEQMLPVYGVAIGKDIVTFAEDGTETYNDGNKVAELTADALSFWQGGNMIAKYTGGRISFYYGSTEAFYIQNGKIYAAGDLEIVTGKKLIISTETFSIDGSGNVIVKGDVSITTGKSLAIKSGGAFTVDSGNFSIDSSGNVVLKGAAEILSGKSLTVKSGGSISIKSGGTFSVDSGNFSIDAQGNATFKGGGTFSGALSAATGTFAGSLSAATGTFAGSLSAATGTFAGTMSAACVTSGTMSCERISGGTLTLGGNNNASGKLVIKNASGTVIGTWDKDGINATTGSFAGSLNGATGTFAGSLSAATGTFAGTMSAACVTSGTMSCERISGGNLTLGGNNNVSGKLVIKDTDGTVIGTWDKDGINATKGTFAGTLNAATGTFAGTMSAACVTSGTMSCERISGGTLTLGGNNNTNGILIIKNASGTEIARMSNAGIETSGNMKIKAGGNFTVETGGFFEVNATNFTIDAQNQYLKSGNYKIGPTGIGWETQTSLQPYNNYFEISTTTYTNKAQMLLSLYDVETRQRAESTMMIEICARDHIYSIPATTPLFTIKPKKIGEYSDRVREIDCEWLNSSTIETGNLINTSSREIKHNIQDLPDQGELLDRMRAVSFVYDEDPEEKTHYGFIHEEVLDIAPDLCQGDTDTPIHQRGIKYTEIIPMLLKEIQGLRKRVKTLEEREEN